MKLAPPDNYPFRWTRSPLSNRSSLDMFPTSARVGWPDHVGDSAGSNIALPMSETTSGSTSLVKAVVALERSAVDEPPEQPASIKQKSGKRHFTFTVYPFCRGAHFNS